MNATKPTLPLRTRLGVGLAVAALALMAGCGNDLSQAGDTTTTSSQPTRTTEATGGDSTTTTSSTSSTTTEPSGGVDGGVASSTSAPTGMTIPTGITLPDGTELTLPEGVDLTIPDGLGGCVDAGAALTRLSLGALGVSSIDNIDQDVTTLKKAFGPASSKDIDIVAQVARDTAEGGQINPGAAANKAYTDALDNLTTRLSEVCGVG